MVKKIIGRKKKWWNKCQTLDKTKATYQNSKIGDKEVDLMSEKTFFCFLFFLCKRYFVSSNWESLFLFSINLCQRHFVSTKWKSLFFVFFSLCVELLKNYGYIYTQANFRSQGGQVPHSASAPAYDIFL